ncbi:hypothetical protein CBR_g19815 [Chara braunii]|uniref:Protein DETOXIFICATION n=1 Tax=Chara braunii TaxID=69332 RepID=A0A388JU91_CHABU|nr:hypothetical protein CBR_g19815 [Chara braunii]|eukprot:GBG61282.1 hypothetical protein CBR_g19815 [Chara braunii]
MQVAVGWDEGVEARWDLSSAAGQRIGRLRQYDRSLIAELMGVRYSGTHAGYGEDYWTTTSKDCRATECWRRDGVFSGGETAIGRRTAVHPLWVYDPSLAISIATLGRSSPITKMVAVVTPPPACPSPRPALPRKSDGRCTIDHRLVNGDESDNLTHRAGQELGVQTDGYGVSDDAQSHLDNARRDRDRHCQHYAYCPHVYPRSHGELAHDHSLYAEPGGGGSRRRPLAASSPAAVHCCCMDDQVSASHDRIAYWSARERGQPQPFGVLSHPDGVGSIAFCSLGGSLPPPPPPPPVSHSHPPPRRSVSSSSSDMDSMCHLGIIEESAVEFSDTDGSHPPRSGIAQDVCGGCPPCPPWGSAVPQQVNNSRRSKCPECPRTNHAIEADANSGHFNSCSTIVGHRDAFWPVGKERSGEEKQQGDDEEEEEEDVLSVSGSISSNDSFCPLLQSDRQRKALLDDEERGEVEDALSVSGSSKSSSAKPTLEEVGSCSAEVRRQARLAGPIIVMNLLWQSRFSVAAMSLGPLGTVTLAGGGLALVLANLTGFCLLSGVSVGIEILCGKAYGAGKFRELSLTVQRGLLLLLAVCVLTTSVWLALPPLLIATGQSPAVVAVTARFLAFLVPDFVACAGVSALCAFLRSQSITRPIMMSTALALGVQMTASWVLINRLDLGIGGVAIALFMTDLTILLSLLLVVALFYRSRWTGFSSECFSNLRPMMAIALPACLAIAVEWWCYELMTVLAGLLPNQAVSVASMSVTSNLSCLYLMVPSGMYLASSIRLTNELGARRPDRARLCAHVGSLLSLVGGLMGLVTMLLCRGTWTPLFTDDLHVIQTVDEVLPFVGLCSLAESPASMAAAIARCTGNQRLPAIIVIPAYAVGLTLGISLAFRTNMGVKAFWMGLAVAQFLNFLLLYLFALRSIDWRRIPVGEEANTGEITGDSEGEGEGEGEGEKEGTPPQSPLITTKIAWAQSTEKTNQSTTVDPHHLHPSPQECGDAQACYSGSPVGAHRLCPSPQECEDAEGARYYGPPDTHGPRRSSSLSQGSSLTEPLLPSSYQP